MSEHEIHRIPTAGTKLAKKFLLSSVNLIQLGVDGPLKGLHMVLESALL